MRSEKFSVYKKDEDDASDTLNDKGEVLKKIITPEAYKEAEKEAREFLEEHKTVLSWYAQDATIRYIFGNKFAFFPITKEISLDLNWFLEKGYTKKQIFWAMLHEFTHFRDCFRNPSDFMKYIFEHAFKKAGPIGDIMIERIEEKFGETDPEIVEKMKKGEKHHFGTMRQVDKIAYDQYHKFFNLLDDIYVNDQVSQTASAFEREVGPDHKDIIALYKEKLFPERDLTNIPFHLQFGYKLLRDEMLPDEPAVVVDEVQKIFDTKCIKLNGEEMTPSELVNQKLKGRNKEEEVSSRYLAIERTLEEIFDRLLKQFFKEQWDPKFSKKKGGSPTLENPFYEDDYDKNNVDQISDDELLDQVNQGKEDQEHKHNKQQEQQRRENMSDEERQKENQKMKDKENEKQYGLPEQAIKAVRDIQQRFELEIQTMSEFWQKMISGWSSISTESVVRRGNISGTNFNVKSFVKEYSNIRSNPGDPAKVYDRRVQEEKKIQFPKVLNVRIVADVSSSMETGARMKVLKQSIVLLVSSLKELRTRINWQKEKIETEVDTQVWMFNDTIEKVKRGLDGNLLESSSNSKENDPFFSNDDVVKLAFALEKLKTDGGNNETNALRTLYGEIDKQESYIQGMQKGEVLHIDFFITDGGAFDLETAETELERLHTSGVICRAFQIGSSSKTEVDTFHKLWNSNGRDFGTLVGANVSGLPSALLKSLKTIIGDTIGMQ